MDRQLQNSEVGTRRGLTTPATEESQDRPEGQGRVCLEEEVGVGRLCPGTRVLRVVPRGWSVQASGARARPVKLAGAGRAGVVSLQKEPASYHGADEHF